MLKKIWRTAVDHPAFFGLCLVAGCEACMNAAYGWSSAPYWPYSLLLAGLYAGSEMAKWFAAEYCGRAISERDWPRAAAAGLLAVCTLAISLPAHIGFIGLMRGGSIAELETSATKRGTAKDEIERYRAELKKLAVTRAEDQITAEQENVKEGTGRWNKLERERLAAVRAVELMGLIAAAEAKLEGNQVGAYADARVAVMKWVWPEANDDELQLGLSVALAICIEAVTLFGFMALGQRSAGEHVSVERLIADGALSLPASEQVVPFRNEALEAAPHATMGADDLVQAYADWARRTGREPMQRAAFLRLIEALGVRRLGDVFVGVRRRVA